MVFSPPPTVLDFLDGAIILRDNVDNLPFGFSVIHNTTVSKILEIQITLIFDEGSRGERCNCCRSPLFVAFKIPDLHSSPPVFLMEWTFHKGIFCLKSQ